MQTKRVEIKSQELLELLAQNTDRDHEAVIIVNELIKDGREPESLNDPSLEDVKYFLGLGEEVILGEIIFDGNESSPFEKMATYFRDELKAAKAITCAYCYSDKEKDSLYWMQTAMASLEHYLDEIETVLFGYKYMPHLQKDEIVLMIIK